jgi:hypothetical protein
MTFGELQNMIDAATQEAEGTGKVNVLVKPVILLIAPHEPEDTPILGDITEIEYQTADTADPRFVIRIKQKEQQ